MDNKKNIIYKIFKDDTNYHKKNNSDNNYWDLKLKRVSFIKNSKEKILSDKKVRELYKKNKKINKFIDLNDNKTVNSEFINNFCQNITNNIENKLSEKKDFYLINKYRTKSIINRYINGKNNSQNFNSLSNYHIADYNKSFESLNFNNNYKTIKNKEFFCFWINKVFLKRVLKYYYFMLLKLKNHNLEFKFNNFIFKFDKVIFNKVWKNGFKLFLQHNNTLIIKEKYFNKLENIIFTFKLKASFKNIIFFSKYISITKDYNIRSDFKNNYYLILYLYKLSNLKKIFFQILFFNKLINIKNKNNKIRNFIKNYFFYTKFNTFWNNYKNNILVYSFNRLINKKMMKNTYIHKINNILNIFQNKIKINCFYKLKKFSKVNFNKILTKLSKYEGKIKIKLLNYGFFMLAYYDINYISNEKIRLENFFLIILPIYRKLGWIENYIKFEDKVNFLLIKYKNIHYNFFIKKLKANKNIKFGINILTKSINSKSKFHKNKFFLQLKLYINKINNRGFFILKSIFKSKKFFNNFKKNQSQVLEILNIKDMTKEFNEKSNIEDNIISKFKKLNEKLLESMDNSNDINWSKNNFSFYENNKTINKIYI